MLSDVPLAELVGALRAGRGRHRWRARNRARLLRPARRGRRDGRRRRHRRGGGAARRHAALGSRRRGRSRRARGRVGARRSSSGTLAEHGTAGRLGERRGRLPHLAAARALRRTTGTLVLDTNLRGTFLGAREAARAMVARGEGGVIVNVSSTAAFRADAPGAAHYVASKFGVRGLTQALAVELGPHGIRVLEVAPTVTLTPGLEEQREALAVGRVRARGARAAASARPRRRAGRRRARRPLLRERPVAADDGKHAARRRRRAGLSG